MRNAYKMLKGKPEGKTPYGTQSTDGRITNDLIISSYEAALDIQDVAKW
jgi:hypothetical protein